MFQNQSGRSMVEMLGVLAIIGVLSIGGIAGYRYAMNKYRANEIINEINLAAVEISGNIKLRGRECQENGKCLVKGISDGVLSNFTTLDFSVYDAEHSDPFHIGSGFFIYFPASKTMEVFRFSSRSDTNNDLCKMVMQNLETPIGIGKSGSNYYYYVPILTEEEAENICSVPNHELFFYFNDDLS